jgi:hypothetical protein
MAKYTSVVWLYLLCRLANRVLTTNLPTVWRSSTQRGNWNSTPLLANMGISLGSFSATWRPNRKGHLMRSIFTVFILTWLVAIGAARPTEAAELPLLFQDNFQRGAAHWQPTDLKAWRVSQTDDGKAYELFAQSKYSPPYRSPFNFALIKNMAVGDFVLTAKVKSTCRDYPHQDMCVIFSYQDAAHFYYAHLGRRADANSNQIMIVNGAPRRKITTKESPGTPWDKNWHDVKVVRHVSNGAIEVYFDNMKKPCMTAADKTFLWGQVGLGSFDDTGMWADVKLRGARTHRP